jgi:hypothetical protein
VSSLESLVGVFKDDDSRGGDSHSVCGFEIDIGSRFGALYLTGSDNGVEQRAQPRSDKRCFDISADSIRTDSHGDASEPLASDIGDDLDLADQMKVGKKDLVNASIEILANQRLHLEVCFVSIQKIVWTKPMTRAVLLRWHDQAKNRKSLLNRVQMSSCTIDKSPIAIEDDCVERSSFEFKVHYRRFYEHTIATDRETGARYESNNLS